MNRFAAVTVAVAALSFAAVRQGGAADMPVKAVPMAPAAVVYNWTGFYIGVQGGYDWGSVAWDYVPTSANNNEDHDTSGWLAGGTIGYNFQVSPTWVIGIEADLAWADIAGGASCPNPAFRCQTEIDAIGTLRGRVGYAFNNNALVYVTGGGAWSRLEAETVLLSGGPVPPSGTPANGQTLTNFGWTVGAGLEWGFAPNWSFKAEYLYMNFGDKNYVVDNGLVVNVSENVSIVRAGINYRFNFGPKW